MSNTSQQVQRQKLTRNPYVAQVRDASPVSAWRVDLTIGPTPDQNDQGETHIFKQGLTSKHFVRGSLEDFE
jgi:hypothetical protein